MSRKAYLEGLRLTNEDEVQWGGAQRVVGLQEVHIELLWQRW